MITVSSNIGQVANRLTSKLREFQESIKDKVLRTVAVDRLAQVKVRIHQEGKNANDSQIGEYSNAYLKRRQKKPYNRTSDSKVIFSLTRKMENEFSVIATDNGYGLGWIDAKEGNSPTNFEKSQFLEDRFGQVYKLTENEKKEISPVADRAVKEELRRLSLL